jgi:hypothetical protein
MTATFHEDLYALLSSEVTEWGITTREIPYKGRNLSNAPKLLRFACISLLVHFLIQVKMCIK